MRILFRVLAVFWVVGFITAHASAHAQEKIKVLSDGLLRSALVQIGEAFHRDSGHQVEFSFGTAPVVHKKVTDGEAADVLIIQPNFVEELVKTGKLVPGEHPVIGRVGFGLTMRADAPALSITTTEELKQALLSADAIVFNNVASGNYFANVLERLTIAEAVKAKVVRVDPPVVFERILKGTGIDIGVSTIPQIIATTGLRLVGPLPAEMQSHIVYAAAPMAKAQSPQVARAFIGYLASPSAKAAFAATGVE